MYTRFLRWATDRVDKNGIVSFVSNNSFIDSRTYDGFRKLVVKDFNEIWIIDLKGNARTSGERRRREGGNVFDDQIRVGIAIYFLVKNEKSKDCKIFYNAIEDYVKSKDKREYLSFNKIKGLKFDKIEPDKNHNWINLTDSDFGEGLPIFQANNQNKKNNIFDFNSPGVAGGRDEWTYDFEKVVLERKIKYLIKQYENTRASLPDRYEKIEDYLNLSIKWTSLLKSKLKSRTKLKYDKKKIVYSSYRPFIKSYFYADENLNDRLTSQHKKSFNESFEDINKVISINNIGSNKQFFALASKYIADYHFTGDSKLIPLWLYKDGHRWKNNISNVVISKYRVHYNINTISAEDIFNYVYSVIHNPLYLAKYKLNLTREHPHIPFYKNFKKWSAWGKELMELHINYEDAKPYNFLRKDEKPKIKKAEQKEFFPKVKEPEPMFSHQPKIKVKLKADKENGKIYVDEVTTLSRIPKLAWEYKLGNRSALEWVLEYYKERKPKDQTIAEKFNNYRFADYKEELIELLRKVCTVSIETMKIVQKMEKESD
jgi:predicted helicase